MKVQYLIHLGFDEVRVAFPLHDIDRVIRTVAVTPVAGAPACLLGIVDIAGETVPVYDMRRLLGLRERSMQPSDRMVLTREPCRFAFTADEVLGILDEEPAAPPAAFSFDAAGVRGVATTGGRMTLVHDLKRFMAPERAISLQRHA